MKLGHPARVKAATALLALSVLYSIVPAFFRTHVSAKITPSRIALYGRRFVALRKTLPAHGVVGYISDKTGDEATWEYYQTQYFLAPLLLDRSSDREFVVGNFQHPYVDADWLANHNLILLQDFGDGVMLFSRKTR